MLAELADVAQVFDIAANRSARLARGRTPLLFALVVLLAVVTTVVLSLDTTAVLLTPVVLAMAEHLDLDPVPFALAAVWLANTASLLPPVSNLTALSSSRFLAAKEPQGRVRRPLAPATAGPRAVAVHSACGASDPPFDDRSCRGAWWFWSRGCSSSSRRSVRSGWTACCATASAHRSRRHSSPPAERTWSTTLLGVNLGPLVLPWGSIATLLWAERCRARGLHVGWVRFGRWGLVLVPLLLLGTIPLL